MPKGELKMFHAQIKTLRGNIITELKGLIGKDTLDVYNNDIFIGDSNTEDLFRCFDNKGGETDSDKLVPWKEMSADLLLLILKILNKNIKILR